ncbi:putative HEAT-like repeat-containing protein [Homarus americanus]|uniref:Putative HEAT-like repeat-containing protein n=1 Tax=Homarus americanus TaxID=6706 RepID=A0A8J5MWU7_HOMAM|nr:putative HEAT-like repeat-containing protein [Homarus americanus]
MFGQEVERIIGGLCAAQKLERDRAVADLNVKIKNFSPELIQSLQKALLSIVSDSASPWESKHGSLLGLRVLVLMSEVELENEDQLEVQQAALKVLTDQEVRVRQAAGEVLGSLCQKDGGATFVSCRSHVLELVRSNLDREMTDDEASRNEHESTRQLMEKLSAGTRERRNSGDAAQIFHDTAGWRNLETSMKCLEHMIAGAGLKFLAYIDQDLLDLIFEALTHTNRFVRETGFNVCGALVSCGAYEGAELLESNPMFTYGDQLSRQLGQGLADNWSQVRLASYYVAEGVRLYSQETWRQVAGSEGKALVEKYIDSVVSYYIEATAADNHAVREAACACIAELALKIATDSVRVHVPDLLHSLTVCFNDDSWPVRDAACVACGNFILCFPEEAQGTMEELYPLFFTNLQDNIPSVRQGAAIAIANIEWRINPRRLRGTVTWRVARLCMVLSSARGTMTWIFTQINRQVLINLENTTQMFSCGSLAPKMGRGGGGCSDCRYRRPPQLWERADGYVYLINELAGVPHAAAEVTTCLPILAEAVRHKHYAAHITLLETLCKTLSHLAKGLGKRVFKGHLYLFLDAIFYALECENALTSSAASQCLTQLSQFLGPNILRGRVEEHNPSYLKALDANRFIAPL